MNPKTPEEVKKKFEAIELKEEKGLLLTLEEEEMLGLYNMMKVKDIHQLDDQKFPNYKFRHLYLIYSSDLSFKNNYFKPNFTIKSSQVFDSLKLREINRQEFNQNTFNNVQKLRRQFNVDIPVEKSEVENDKKYLENVAKDWARNMLIENHTDQNLVLLSKETRDTIKKKNIEYFLADTLSEENKTDVVKALLKSKYINNEALKTLERIGQKDLVINLLCIPVHFNYGSVIHILNGHYAQLSSNDLISNSKTFHLPQVNPDRLYQILLYIFKKINAKKNLVGQINPEKPIYIKYKNIIYAIYISPDKLNKGKINLRTFYQIDENTQNGKNDLDKIRKSIYITLASNLGIYKTSAKS